jgi:predicted nucleic acid-binding Zn ribbon protein
MPVYVFECERCSQRHELQIPMKHLQNVTEEMCQRRTSVDTLCNGKLRRVYTPPVIRIN